MAEDKRGFQSPRWCMYGWSVFVLWLLCWTAHYSTRWPDKAASAVAFCLTGQKLEPRFSLLQNVYCFKDGLGVLSPQKKRLEPPCTPPHYINGNGKEHAVFSNISSLLHGQNPLPQKHLGSFQPLPAFPLLPTHSNQAVK